MSAPVIANAPARHLTQSLLPWESEEDLLILHAEWRAAYKPQGPAEESLVDQLVWIDWRRRRLVLGERSVHMAQAYSRTGTGSEYRTADALVRRAIVDKPDGIRKHNSRTALSTFPEEDRALADDAQDDMKQTQAALMRLEAGGKDAFVEALAFLRDDSREWWEQTVEDEGDRFTCNADGLAHFINFKLLPMLREMLQEAEERPSVRLQAWGESLEPHKMNTLFGLDERLCRQFEKAMGMLIKLQELRANADPKG